MKKISLLITAFIIYTIIIKIYPPITIIDKSLLILVQNRLSNIPIVFALLPDCKLYSLMITIPMIIGLIFYVNKKQWLKACFICIVPLLTYILNCILKVLIHRIRPPYELQQIIHPASYSYVSSHSLVTATLYGIVILYFINSCKNKLVKSSVILLSIIWIFYVGLSRIWLGVHYPTDVLGAYLLGFILVLVYSKIRV